MTASYSTAQRGIRKFIGDKNFYKTVLMIVLPIIAQNAVTNFVSLLDNVMIGQVDTDSMNAVAIVNQLLFVFNLCMWGAISGAGIFTVQFYGAGDEEGVRNTFRAKLVLSVSVLILGCVVFFFGGEWLITQFLHKTDDIGDPTATLNYAQNYLRIMMIGLIPFAFSMSYSNTLRDLGQTVIPMVAGISAVLVNLILNYILIFGNFGAPRLGVSGAAIATVISRYVETGIVMIYTHTHGKRFSFIRHAYRKLIVPGSLIRQILIKGLPLAVNETLWALGITMMNQCYSTRGLAVVSAVSIASTISNLFNTVYLAIGESISIIVGPMLGAGEMEKAKDWDRKMIAFGVTCCLVIGGALAACSGLFPRFYNTEEEVRTLATQFIRVCAAMMPIYSLMHASYFTLRTGGRTFITFLFDSGCVWAVTVPAAFVLSRFTSMPILPMYITVSALDVIKCVVGIVLVKKGIWLNNIVKKL